MTEIRINYVNLFYKPFYLGESGNLELDVLNDILRKF